MELTALLVLHVLNGVIIGVGASWALRQRRLYTFLFAGLLAYHVFMTIGLGSLIDEFGANTVFVGELVILLACTFLLAATWFFERLTASIATTSITNPVVDAASHWPQYFTIILLWLSVTMMIVASRGAPGLEMNWEQFRSEAAFVDSIVALLQFLVFPAAWVAFRAGRRVWAIALLSVAVIMFPVLGSRAALLTLPAVVALDLLRSNVSRRTAYRVLGALALAALSLHILGRAVRGLGIGGLYRIVTGQSDGAEVAREAWENMEWTGGETEIARYFTFVVDHDSFADVTPLVSVLRWLMIYVPRPVFPALKPEDGTYILWRYAANGGMFDDLPFIDRMLEMLRVGESGSIHPMLWGEFWLNGGWAAIPIAAFVLGFVIVAIERIMERSPSLSAALVAPATVVGYLMVARGNSVVGLGYFFYLFPLAVVSALACGAFKSVCSYRGYRKAGSAKSSSGDNPS